MKDHILNRLQELSAEIEHLLEERQSQLKRLKQLDSRIKELSVIIPELQSILDLSDQSSLEEPSSHEPKQTDETP
jgi:predicted transcriptional regulator